MPDAAPSLQERLETLYAKSSPEDQDTLMAIFTAASGDEDVQGFQTATDKTAQMFAMLSNIIRNDNETANTITQNLR